MLKSDAIKHFGGIKPLAQALGEPYSTVYAWRTDYVPEHHARRLHELTQGALHYNPELYAGLRRSRRDIWREKTSRAWAEGRFKKRDHATAAKRKERTRHE